MKRKIFFSVLLTTIFLMAQNLVAAQTLMSTDKPKGTPTKALQDLDAMLEQFHIGKLTPQQEQENIDLKRKIIHGTFNIHELAKISLAKHWETLSPEEQKKFVQLLTDILEEKALFSKEQVAAKSKSQKKYNISYKNEKYLDAERGRAFVGTKVFVPSENVSIILNYKLKLTNNEWKIFDVIVDDASLVDNYRYQFDSIIKKSGYPELVRRMSNKLEEIKAKRQKS